MSNLAFVVALVIFALGGIGLTIAVFSIQLNNKFKREIAELEAELALSKENHIRNANIARRAFVREGKLEDRVTFLETSAKNGWEDAAEKWDSLLEARKQISDLKEKIETLEAWIASPPPAPTSKPAFAQDEDGIW